MLDIYTPYLTAVEAVGLSFFLDRIITHQGKMISDLLHSDVRFNAAMTLYIFSHIAAMFCNSGFIGEQCVLAIAAVGWCMLLAITVHRSRLWHFIGVGVYCIGMFVYGMFVCSQIDTPWFELLVLDICVCSMLAIAYFYLCISLSDRAYIPQHAFFFIGQTTSAVVVHFYSH